MRRLSGWSGRGEVVKWAGRVRKRTEVVKWAGRVRREG